MLIYFSYFFLSLHPRIIYLRDNLYLLNRFCLFCYKFQFNLFDWFINWLIFEYELHNCVNVNFFFFLKKKSVDLIINWIFMYNIFLLGLYIILRDIILRIFSFKISYRVCVFFISPIYFKKKSRSAIKFENIQIKIHYIY